jgi:mannose/cellobiose epimerase-like protein (N-acyl-D-glucosamine 2-epimerase family)
LAFDKAKLGFVRRKEREVYQRFLLPGNTPREDFLRVGRDYEQMLVEGMAALLNRFDPSYPYINSKLNLLTGKDFDAQDPIRGRNAIYGWIQGRGLEALAGHCQWMTASGQGEALVPGLRKMMRVVLDRMREVWRQNGERLWFFMQPDGQPFTLGPGGRPVPFDLTADTPFGFSDLFASKGMFAAACALADNEARDAAARYIAAVEDAIWTGRFENDQVTLDPKNPVETVPGRRAHGPYMIQIGTAALLVLQGDARGIPMGLKLIRHELDHFVNLNGRIADFEEGDMWEATSEDGRPYRDRNGAVLSDPGHALEFVGLALKFTDAAKRSGDLGVIQGAEVSGMEDVMPGLLKQNFENGFLGKGISKAFDLVGRKAMNTDLPWWNLPETMRAAAFCRQIASREVEWEICDEVFLKCHNAFVSHFVQPELHLMAFQTLTERGDPVDIIPATSDADPGYHTGLSMIDVLSVLDGHYLRP